MSQPVIVEPPQPDEYAPYYGRYIAQVPETNILAELESQIRSFHDQMDTIPESRGGYRYEAGKWSIREVIGHINDGERIFAYRALRFSRADTTPLPGFEQDDFMREAPFERCRVADLIAEWDLLRRANLHMFRSLDPAAWKRSGIASDNLMSVRALAYVMVGHTRHHLETLRTRYA
jgi:hypothetical protein